MNKVRGRSVLAHTITNILKNFPSSKIVVAAPEFDVNGELQSEVNSIAKEGMIALYFGHSESPLKRMLEAHQKYLTGNCFLRLDALNMAFNPEDAKLIWDLGCEGNFDCIKFDDDYPAQLTIDFYRSTALSNLNKELLADSPFQIHPKYALFNKNNYITRYYIPNRPISESLLLDARNDAKIFYIEPRDEIKDSIEIGDTLSFHYKLALPYIKKTDQVLDIACGGSAGPKLLASRAKSVIAGDIDENIIKKSQKNSQGISNLQFLCEDATHTTFQNAQFDLITSFETIEHVDATIYLKEIHRILKSGGYFLLSTPQNSQGEIPINPHHHIEYSLEQIIKKISAYFTVIKIIGIKQGCIVIDGDSKGGNTFAILQKP